MSITSLTRARIGIASVILFGLILTGQLLFGLLSHARELASHLTTLPGRVAKYDAITLFEGRFERLKAQLPPDEVVGYVSDFTGYGAMREYRTTQYTLVPALLVERTDLPLVVGNFHGALPSPTFLADKKLVLIRDFGKGVLLFRGQAQ